MIDKLLYTIWAAIKRFRHRNDPPIVCRTEEEEYVFRANMGRENPRALMLYDAMCRWAYVMRRINRWQV